MNNNKKNPSALAEGFLFKKTATPLVKQINHFKNSIAGGVR